MKKLKFPKDFLWGTATSAYQVEGGIENSDWSKVYPAGLACNHYDLYEEDFDLMKKLNQTAFRLSIEWSRIEPEEGKFDKKEIEHYRRYLQSLKARKIKTMVTLHHFTNPLWLGKIGGWTDKKVVFYFSRFAKKVFDEYKDLVDFWITINEPLIFASQSYLISLWPPQKKNPFLFLKVIENQVAAHKKVYTTFHKMDKKALIGISKNNIYFEGAGSFVPRYFWNKYFLNKTKKYQDFIGLNYYFHRPQDKNKQVSDIGWEIYPEGIYRVLKELKKYQKPIYITENGLADAKDKLRKDFIKNHLFWLHKAIEEGVDVRGYFHWSLMDNFEWEKGFEPRFGLIEIDYKTLERKIRPSALFYAKICKENALILCQD